MLYVCCIFNVEYVCCMLVVCLRSGPSSRVHCRGSMIYIKQMSILFLFKVTDCSERYHRYQHYCRYRRYLRYQRVPAFVGLVGGGRVLRVASCSVPASPPHPGLSPRPAAPAPAPPPHSRPTSRRWLLRPSRPTPPPLRRPLPLM